MLYWIDWTFQSFNFDITSAEIDFKNSKSVLSNSQFEKKSKMVYLLNIVKLLIAIFENESSSGSITAEEHHFARIIVNSIQKEVTASKIIQKSTLW